MTSLSRKRPDTDDIATIAPALRSIIPGTNSFTARKVEVRLSSITVRNSSSSISHTGVKWEKPPANAISTSTGPSSASVRSRITPRPAHVAQSALIPIASPPASRTAATLASIASCPRATTATRAPFSPSILAVAAPIPFDPPVTTATLPRRSPKIGVGVPLRPAPRRRTGAW